MNQYTEYQISEKYYQYKSVIYRIAFSWMGNREESEDILQNVFLKWISLCPDFNSEEHEKRWFIRVTINLCKDAHKNFWRKNKVSISDISELLPAPQEASLFQEIVNLELRYKTVIHLYYFEGYLIDEIAEILNLSVSAVKMRLKRGREKLKIELERDELL